MNVYVKRTKDSRFDLNLNLCITGKSYYSYDTGCLIYNVTHYYDHGLLIKQETQKKMIHFLEADLTTMEINVYVVFLAQKPYFYSACSKCATMR